MASFTVPSEISQAQFVWTGVQTAFPCGFPVLDPAYLLIQYTSGTPASTVSLVPNLHVQVLIDALTGNVTLLPLASMPAAPGTLTCTRNTTATQPVQFSNLETYLADTQTVAFDRAMMSIAELKRRVTVLEGAQPVVPGTFVFAARAQRAISSSQNLPITALDSILNLNLQAQLNIPLPVASTRGGAPLTFKNLRQSLAGAILVPQGGDTIEGSVNGWQLGIGNSLTLVPFNDGTNQGYALE